MRSLKRRLSHYKTTYAHALKAYNNPESQRDHIKFLSLLSLMADLGNPKENKPQTMGKVEL